jgi:hypothetical protein
MVNVYVYEHVYVHVDICNCIFKCICTYKCIYAGLSSIRSVWHWNEKKLTKQEHVRYWTKLTQSGIFRSGRNYKCRNADADVSSLDADAQLQYVVHHLT